ncbi:hypothetical protein [Halomonas sp.]|uniref:hypothetical protein n=1 Tax=Halomonas sp. TaxID=1486246 RepID=UPI003D0D7726
MTAILEDFGHSDEFIDAFGELDNTALVKCLIDEGRYTDAELGLRQTPLSGVFSIENAGESWEALQQAGDRVVATIQAGPHKVRTDRIITRWLKRHLHRLGAGVNLDQLDSLVEDSAGPVRSHPSTTQLPSSWRARPASHSEKERTPTYLTAHRRRLL